MGFLTKLLGSRSGDSESGGSAEIERPQRAEPGVGGQVWNKALAQAGGVGGNGMAKGMLQARGTPGVAPVQPGMRPEMQAWDKYMQRYGATGDTVDPGDAQLFKTIWE